MADVRFVHRDDHLVVVDKPPGIVVHRGYANDRDVLMTRVRDALGSWVYPVHRLDRGASGVVVLARSSEIAAALSRQFADRSVGKTYLALVRGKPPDRGTIDHPIPKHDPPKRSPGSPAEKAGRVDAVTDFECIERFGRYALVRAMPRTGRYHQIRRHLKHISCPLIGDVKYGKGEHNRLFRGRYDLHRLALHGIEIELVHPGTGERVRYGAALAPDLAGAVERLRGADAELSRPDLRSR